MKVGVPVPCRVLLDQVAEAYATGDAAGLKALYAEGALICSAALPDTVLTPRRDVRTRGSSSNARP